jgi:glycosyltransferase involved in cell wall biosynthesis
MRGGEKVLLALIRIYPDAHIYTLFWKRGSVHAEIEKRVTATSFLDRLPWTSGSYRYYFPLFPLAVEAFDLRGYDLVISVSHCVAKGALTPPGCFHISYVLTPMRYAWDMSEEYFGRGRMGKPLLALLSPVLSAMRVWDSASANRVDHFIADSDHVRRRIGKFYRRESSVVYPPVDVGNFYLGERVENYYLFLGSFAPYKRADLAIEAALRSGRTLYMIGTGQDEKRLRKLAAGSRHIKFLGWLEDEELAKYLSRARALIFPGEEDFGIVPLESLASGRPVLAYARGGVLETITGAGERDRLIERARGMPRFEEPVQVAGGVLFPRGDVSSIIRGMDLIESIDFNPRRLRDMALAFRPEVFTERMGREVETVLSRGGAGHAQEVQ